MNMLHLYYHRSAIYVLFNEW